MWIVRLALRRPYTFVVMSMLIAILGAVTIGRMPTDIFPEIDIPVISVVWNYTGISPDDMETRVVGNFERVLVSTVNDIEHLESQSLNGIAVVKIFLQPHGNVDAAISQVVSSSEAVLKNMPPGIFAPLVLRYSASNVPILQASLGSDTLSEQQLFDLATNNLRPGMASVPGANSVSLWRQAAPDHDRRRSGKIVRLEPLGRRRVERRQRAKSHFARRQREDWRCRNTTSV